MARAGPARAGPPAIENLDLCRYPETGPPGSRAETRGAGRLAGGLARGADRAERVFPRTAVLTNARSANGRSPEQMYA